MILDFGLINQELETCLEVGSLEAFQAGRSLLQLPLRFKRLVVLLL